MQFTVAQQVSGIKTSLERDTFSCTHTHPGHLTLAVSLSAAVNVAISLLHSCDAREVGQRRQPDTATKEEFTSVTIARHSPAW